MRKFLLNLVVLILITAPAGAQESITSPDTNQILGLLGTYREGCSLMNGPGGEANAAVVSLINNIKSAYQSKACQGLAGVLSQLQSDQLEATSWYNDVIAGDAKTPDEILIDQNKVVIADYMSLTLGSNSSDEKKQYVGLMKAKELENQKLRVNVDAYMENERRIRQGRAIRSLQGALNASLNTIVSNEDCWVQHPSVLQSAAAAASAVGYSAAHVTPAAIPGIAIGAGFHLIARSLEFITKLKARKRINAFVSVVTPASLICALEKMNTIYCEANDRHALLDYVSDNRQKVINSRNSKNSYWLAMRVLNRDLPLAIDWLEKIRSSGVPTDEISASIQNSLDKSELTFQTATSTFSGSYKKISKIFNDDANMSQEAKFSYIRDFLTGLYGNICLSSGGANSHSSSSTKSEAPICNLYPLAEFPYRVLGLNSTQILNLKTNNAVPPFSETSIQSLEKAGFMMNYDLTALSDNFFTLKRLSQSKFTREKDTLVSADPESVFAEAYAYSPSVYAKERSPYQSFQNIRDFLEKKVSERRNLAIYDKTIMAVKLIIRIIELVNEQETIEIDGEQRLVTAEMGKEFLKEEANLPESILQQLGIPPESWPCRIVNRDGGATISEEDRVGPQVRCAPVLIKLNINASFIRDRIHTQVKNKFQTMLAENLTNFEDPVDLQLLLASDMVDSLLQTYGADPALMQRSLNEARSQMRKVVDPFLEVFEDEFRASLSMYDDYMAMTSERNGADYQSKTYMCFLSLMSNKKMWFLRECKGIHTRVRSGEIGTPPFSKELYSEYSDAKRVCLYRNIERKNKVLRTYQLRNMDFSRQQSLRLNDFMRLKTQQQQRMRTEMH